MDKKHVAKQNSEEPCAVVPQARICGSTGGAIPGATQSQESQPHIDPQTDGEAIFLAQALDYYRAVKRAGKDAPFGQFLNHAEAAVMKDGRELLRQSLENITQEAAREIEKKKETRECPTCQRKMTHHGLPGKNIETAIGTVRPKRLYLGCGPCDHLEHPADAPLGLEEGYTVGFRCLAVRAGSKNSFEEAEEDLQVYCGLETSHMTIRMLCHQEAPKIKKWVDESTDVSKSFIEAKGNVEITMDAAKVYTKEGWRDIKVGLFSKRPLGEGVEISYWDKRTRKMLPDISVCVGFAAVEEKVLFQEHVNQYRSLLRVGSTGDISALGDGAEWIWNIIRDVFGNIRECLDVYHALEHLSDTRKILYKEGTKEYMDWYEATKGELLGSGFEEIEQRLDKLDKEEWGKDEREALRKLRGYFENHKTRLGYRERLSEGRVIGSGQVEGACKSMIKRIKQTNAHWHVDRLNQMAVLCAVHYSDLWKKYWTQAN